MTKPKKKRKHRYFVIATDLAHGQSCTVVSEVKDGVIYVKSIRYRKDNHD